MKGKTKDVHRFCLTYRVFFVFSFSSFFNVFLLFVFFFFSMFSAPLPMTKKILVNRLLDY